MSFAPCPRAFARPHPPCWLLLPFPPLQLKKLLEEDFRSLDDFKAKASQVGAGLE